MQTGYRFSIFLNLCLGGIILVFLLQGRLPLKSSAAPSVAFTETSGTHTDSFQTATSANKRDFLPFRWEQLESEDYQIYVSNLRNVGCPEQTIRDIITADVGSLYVVRRERLAREAEAPSEPGLVPARLDPRLQALREEELALIDSLMGTASMPAAKKADIAILARPGRKPVSVPEVIMPLVFQSVDVSALHFDQTRIQIISDLRQGFLAAIGDGAQNPADPAYRERWLKAQAESDSILQAMIGVRAFQEYAWQANAAGEPATLPGSP